LNIGHRIEGKKEQRKKILPVWAITSCRKENLLREKKEKKEGNFYTPTPPLELRKEKEGKKKERKSQ